MPCSRQSPAGFARRFLRLMAVVEAVEKALVFQLRYADEKNVLSECAVFDARVRGRGKRTSEIRPIFGSGTFSTVSLNARFRETQSSLATTAVGRELPIANGNSRPFPVIRRERQIGRKCALRQFVVLRRGFT